MFGGGFFGRGYPDSSMGSSFTPTKVKIVLEGKFQGRMWNWEEVFDSTAAFKDIRERVAEKLRVPVQSVKLTYKGRWKVDDDLILNSMVKQGAKVNFLLNPGVSQNTPSHTSPSQEYVQQPASYYNPQNFSRHPHHHAPQYPQNQRHISEVEQRSRPGYPPERTGYPERAHAHATSHAGYQQNRPLSGRGHHVPQERGEEDWVHFPAASTQQSEVQRPSEAHWDSARAHSRPQQPGLSPQRVPRQAPAQQGYPDNPPNYSPQGPVQHGYPPATGANFQPATATTYAANPPGSSANTAVSQAHESGVSPETLASQAAIDKVSKDVDILIGKVNANLERKEAAILKEQLTQKLLALDSISVTPETRPVRKSLIMRIDQSCDELQEIEAAAAAKT